MKKLYLVDVSSIFFRAFYAIPPMNTKGGLPTNALYGFLSMTIKLLRDIKPDYIAFCFDRKEPSFRLDLYPDYKANRTEMPEDLIPQIPYVKKLTEILGIPQFDKPGFEADDVIGTLTQCGLNNKLEVIIVSGDKDFAQLVQPRVSMFDTMKSKTYNEAGVMEKWGVTPEQMIDYLALVGDSSDNIPGVRGIGPKGAQKLLGEFKSLEGVYKNIENITGKSMKAKLIENQDMAYLSKKLVTIVTDIDLNMVIDDLKLKSIDKINLQKILMELDFKSFEKKLVPNSTKSEPTDEDKVKTTKKKTTKASSEKKMPEVTWSLAELKKNIEPYSEFWAHSSSRGVFFSDTEQVILVDGELKEVGSILATKHLNWKGFNLKSLWKLISFTDIVVPAWEQMLAAYVIKHSDIKDFESIYELYTGKMVPDLASPSDYFQCHFELEKALKKKLKTVEGELVLKEMELPLVPVLHSMELNGIYIDTKELSRQSKALEKDLQKLEEQIYKEAGEKFNVASSKQLGQILFEKMAIPPTKKTKTGFSTSSDVLEKLSEEHPIAKYALEYREYAKLKSTYVDVLPQLVDEETHKVHTCLRQASTATGRLSSVNPNLQNIPIRTDRGRMVRKAFVAIEGSQFLSADYSQIELRVLAHITDDPYLCRAFGDDVDIHAATAAEIYNIKLGDVTADIRRAAKAVNFGIAYGQGVFGLAQSLGISRHEASDIIDRYFKKFKNIKSYMEGIVDKAKKNGYVETIFGRRRYIEELQSKNRNIRAFGERAAINAPIQGTASDIVKKAMIKIFDEVTLPMVLQVHDELLFECPMEELEEQAQQIKELMETTVELKVPLKVNMAWGQNWDDAHA